MRIRMQSWKLLTHCVCHVAVVSLMAAAHAPAHEVVFFDNFGNGDIATGGDETVRAGFKANDKVSEADGNAVLDASSGRWGTASMSSRHTFNVAAAQRISWTTVVDHWTGSDMNKKFIVGIQPQAGNADGPGLRWQLASNGSYFRLIAQDAGGKNKPETLFEDTSFDPLQLADGFTVTVTAEKDGWSMAVSGAATLADEDKQQGGDNVVSGNWGENAFADLFTESTYLNASIKNGGIPTAKAELDAIQVTSGAPVPFKDDPDPGRTPDVQPPKPVKNRRPVIFDTDIGDDIDDTWTLALLLKCPELDVRLMVTDEGKREYRGKLIAKLLEAAGRTDIPVGLGVPVDIYEGGHKIRNWQEEWVADYDLDDYPGKIHRDGVQAMIDTIMKEGAPARPVIVITAGPVTNLEEALNREPKIAQRAAFYGMAGEIAEGRNESNVLADPDALKAVFEARWEKTLAPVDTAGDINLMGQPFVDIRDADDPLLNALMTNYEIWSHDWLKTRGKKYYPWGSSTLFDTLPVYLAAVEDPGEMVEMETLKLVVQAKQRGDGKTLIDAKGAPVHTAVKWAKPNGLEEFETWLHNRLLSPTVRR